METGTFRGLTLNYKHASIEVRERVSLNEEETKLFLSNVKEFLNPSELLVLSTCNRTEIYYTSTSNLDSDLIKLLCIQKGIERTEVKKSFLSLSTTESATQQLFSVSLGLESQVIGDLQIINQVKKAYQWIADLELAGPFLHRLLHTIFYSNKRVVQETSFRDGAASVSYASVELIQELASTLREPRVLVLGLGEMGVDICDNLKNSDLTNITIANRTVSKAKNLAEKTGFTFSGLDNIKELIQSHDIIISSVSKETPIIDIDLVDELEILSFKYFIDIAVPRSIETGIEKRNGVVLYNIDEIQNRASEALEKRKASIPLVESILSESINEFDDWSKEFEVSPTIQRFKNALEEIRKEEISRHLKSLDSNDLEKIELITKNITQKIIKLPVMQLKAACKRGEAETLIDVLNDLFNLEKIEVK